MDQHHRRLLWSMRFIWHHQWMCDSWGVFVKMSPVWTSVHRKRSIPVLGAEIGFTYIRYSHRAACEPRQVRLHIRLGYCSRWPPITQYMVNMDRSDLTNPHTRSYGGHRRAGGHIGYEILSNHWVGLVPCVDFQWMTPMVGLSSLVATGYSAHHIWQQWSTSNIHER